MKTYEYKIITVWRNATMNDVEFNELGKNGFRVISSTTISDSQNQDPQCYQFLMEKEIFK